VGGNSGFKMPSSGLEFCAQLREGQSPRKLSLGQSSNHNPSESIPIPPKDVPIQGPVITTEELLACGQLSRVWGGLLPLPAIIHRTCSE